MGPLPFFYGFFPLARAPKESKWMVKEKSPSPAEKAGAQQMPQAQRRLSRPIQGRSREIT